MKNLRFTLLAIFGLIGQISFAQDVTNYGDGSGTGGSLSVYFGVNTGRVSTAISNVFVGSNSGYNNTTGAYNTFMGQATGYKNTTGGNNTFVGHWSGNRNTTGNNNTGFGYRTARRNTTGAGNSFFGYMSGHENTTGNNNLFLGFQAGYKNTTGASNVFIGYKAGYNETGSNKLYIENSNNLTTPLIYGDFSANGVGINTNQLSDGSTDYTLSVNGKVRATEVKVYTGWADYVFEEGYQLRSLEEVEAHINQNGHLPDVPSAKVVEKDGIFVGEMNATLLRKIEELTLYMIESNKATKALQKEVATLKKENQALKAKIQK
ncbi:MAG TPA: hypothetical protein DCS93_24475 [Microscillaceae bacterium]|nr:hypothetical protein [Microscillaceae bacterium]